MLENRTRNWLAEEAIPTVRRGSYIAPEHEQLDIPEPMPVTAVEMGGLRRGIVWGLAISCPFWAIALGATLIAVFGGSR